MFFHSKLTTFYTTIGLLGLLINGCVVEEDNLQEEVDFLANLESVSRVFPETDTLTLSDKSSPFEVTIDGRFVNEISGDVTHTGLFSERTIRFSSSDTTYDRVPGSLIGWTSSAPAVASVNKGIVTIKQAGTTTITAQVRDLPSISFILDVQATPVAPWLSVNNPDLQLIFKKPVTISGKTELRNSGSWKPVVSLTNSDSQAVTVSSDGTWSTAFNDLSQGINFVEIRATNPDQLSLFSQKFLVITYFEIGTPEADQIVGTWRGTYGTTPLRFEVKKNDLVPGLRYDINLHIDIDLEFVGYVSDVNLPGVIDHEGGIDVNGTVKIEGFNLQVVMKGKFKDTGHADGTMKLKLSRSGFPTISSTENWTATKSTNTQGKISTSP